MMKFVLILFLIAHSFSVLCQTKTDSTGIKNDETKKRILGRLSYWDSVNSGQNDFVFWGKMKQPEKFDMRIKLSDKQIMENQTIMRWKRYELEKRLWMNPRYRWLYIY